MAVGRFGRRRRGNAANLTMLIATLMREQRQQEDRAANDAWANGGEFQGSPMTDARYVAYLKGRRDSFSKDDALWDQFNNQVIQTEFSIGEQKVGLAFKQGKVGAGAVAAFYRSQLSKIPQDSAFYREVAGRAAEWAKAASGAARGAGKARAKKAAEAKLDGLKATIASHDALVNAVTEEAKRRGLINGKQTLFDADATDLTGMFENLVINGKAVTFDDWRQSSLSAYNAMGQAIPVYKALDWDTKGLNEDRQKFLNGYLSNINAIDDRKKYELAREIWLDRIDSAQGDPFLEAQYTQDYVSSLSSIYKQGLNATGLDTNDSDFLGAITNEISALTTGKPSGPTPTDLIEGGEQDAKSSAETVAGLQNAIQLLSSGQAFYGQSEPGGALGVIPYPPNAAIDPFGRKGLGDDYQQSVTKVGGETRVVYLKGAAIKGAILRAPDGSAIDLSAINPSAIPNLIRQGYYPEQQDTVVGYMFQKPGGKAPTYGVYDAQGNLQFTDQNPFVTGLYGAGEGLLVYGNPTLDGEKNVVLNPGSVLANPNMPLSPIPVDPEIGQAEMNRLLGNAGLTPLGLSPEKAFEYDNWRRAQQAPQTNTIISRAQQDRMSQGTAEAAQSPAQSAINAALAAAQASLSAFTRNRPPDQYNPIPSPTPAPAPPPTLPTPFVTPQPTSKEQLNSSLQSFVPSSAQLSIAQANDTTGGAGAAAGSWTAVQKYLDQQAGNYKVSAVNPKSGLDIR